MTTLLKAAEQIFLDARELPDPRVRAAFVATACAGNPNLAAQVAELLAQADEADRVFAACDQAGGMNSGGSDRPGMIIGRYRLVLLQA